MSERWWYATDYAGPSIKWVEVDRSSDKSVWINGRKNARETSHYGYFQTWEAAHAFLLRLREADLLQARRQLQYAQSRHGNVVGMRKPDKPGEKP